MEFVDGGHDPCCVAFLQVILHARVPPVWIVRGLRVGLPANADVNASLMMQGLLAITGRLLRDSSFKAQPS